MGCCDALHFTADNYIFVGVRMDETDDGSVLKHLQKSKSHCKKFFDLESMKGDRQRASVIVANNIGRSIPQPIRIQNPEPRQPDNSCCHKMHVFKHFNPEDTCTRTETLLQLRLTLSSEFPDGKKPRNFAKLLLESWNEHFTTSKETTRSLAQKLSSYDRREEKEVVTNTGKINDEVQ